MASPRFPWNSALFWVSKASIPASSVKRYLNEHIAGLALIQENQARRNRGLPPFKYATILNTIHESASDTYAHITLAVATMEMVEQHTHFVLHGRTINKLYVGCFTGYENLRKDNNLLRAAYKSPVRARWSLVPEDGTDDDAPVGCMKNPETNEERWYVLGEDGPVYLDDIKFFRVGEGTRQRIQFWHPVRDKLCYAKFKGDERPPLQSPDPQPLSLEDDLSALSLTEQAVQEWVMPDAKIDKTGRPVRFVRHNGKEVRTHWSDWLAYHDDETAWFVCDGSGTQYCCYALPGEWVAPYYSDGTIRWTDVEDRQFRLKKKYWVAGKNDSFVVCLMEGKFFLAWELPDAA